MGKHSAWLIAALLVGCVDSSSVQCGFGLCPQGSTCDEAAKVCIPAGCGDGVVSGDEQCDGAVDPTFDCTAFGFYQADGLKCSSACKLDTSGCAQTCGDHEINGPETCDGIPPLNQTCGDYGFGLGRLECSAECAPGFAQCQPIGWHRGRASATDDLHGMWGSGQSNIYAIGNTGVILHAGADGVYHTEASGTTANLNGIWGASPTDVFAVGDGGTLLHSDGSTWTTIASGTTTNLNAISGHLTISGTTVTNVQIWAVGDTGTIVSTAYAPGGTAAWSAETSGVTARLRGVWADGTSSVVAVGDAIATGSGNPTALQRQLTAATWTAVPTQTIQVAGGATPTLMAVWGSGAGFVAVGTPTLASNPPHGVVLEYTPNTGGVFAFTGQATSTQLLTSVWGTVTPLPSDPTKTRTDVFIGGNGGTMLHFDGFAGAAHFDALHMNTTLGAYGIWGTGPAFVRAAMIGGDVLEYDGTDLGSEVVAPGVKLDAIWHDPVSNIAIAAGASGTVVRHDFSGWGTPTTPNNTLSTWTGILGFGSTVFMCGENGNGIIKSLDDGVSWSNNTGSTPGVFWEALWGLSATSVWAVGNGGHVSHYDGVNWSAPIVVPFTPIPALRSVWGSSDTDLFAVGSNGFIGHYNGTSWTQLDSTLVSGQTVNGVWGSGPNDVFAGADNGIILHYDGLSWKRMTSGTGGTLGSIGGTSHADVFIGGRGALFHYIGGAWSPMDPAIADVYALWAEQQDTFFVGTGEISRLRRVAFASETRCGDPWDNDYDGRANCEDLDCYPANQPPDSGCRAGGLCGPTTPIVCGGISAASTYTGLARIDDMPCLDHSTPGPEATYKFVADHDGSVTVTLDDPGGVLDLAQVGSFDVMRTACDISTCIAAPSTGDRSVTFPATSGSTYYFVVDGPAASAESFTINVVCD